MLTTPEVNNPAVGYPFRSLKYNQHEHWSAYERGRFVHDFGVDLGAAELWRTDPEAFEHRAITDPAFAAHQRAVRSIRSAKHK